MKQILRPDIELKKSLNYRLGVIRKSKYDFHQKAMQAYLVMKQYQSATKTLKKISNIYYKIMKKLIDSI